MFFLVIDSAEHTNFVDAIHEDNINGLLKGMLILFEITGLL